MHEVFWMKLCQGKQKKIEELEILVKELADALNYSEIAMDRMVEIEEENEKKMERYEKALREIKYLVSKNHPTFGFVYDIAKQALKESCENE